MALPTTQKECTTRRIAALISGLWDKVKNAFQTKLPTTGTPSSTYSIGITGNSSTSDYPSGFNNRGTTTSWGTVKESNGYTTVTRWATQDGSEIAMGKKSGALSVQIDGMYYQNEGQYQVLDTSSRGAANGVASLDANGKVPNSQLPDVPTGNLPANSSSSAGIVASGNGQASKVWMTDASGNPAWRIAGMNDVFELKFGKTGAGPFYFHLGTLAPMGTSGNSDTLLVSGIGNSGAQLDTAIIDILFRGTNPEIAFTFLSGTATGYSNIGWYRDTNNAYHLFIECANWSLSDQCIRVLKKGNALTIDCYELGAEPSSPTYITPNYVARLPIGTQMGGASVPVYVDSNGNIKECSGVAASNGNYPGLTAGLASIAETLPRSFINKNSQTTKVWKKIATSKVFTTWQKASIAFFICADGYGDVLGLESMISVSIRTGGGGSLSNAYVGKYNFRNYCSVELLKIGSTNQYEIWVKAPLTDTNAQIVYLNSQEGWTIDTSSDQSVQKTDSEYSTYKSSNPSVADGYYHTYNIAKSSTSQTGGPSIPVYANGNGELVACTNIPVIEHVTAIPVDPTVGTIYAL